MSAFATNYFAAAATHTEHCEVYGGEAMMGERYTSHVERESARTYATNYPLTFTETVESDMTHREWLADEVVIGGECSHPECIVVSTYSSEDNSYSGVCLGCGERF